MATDVRKEAEQQPVLAAFETAKAAAQEATETETVLSDEDKLRLQMMRVGMSVRNASIAARRDSDAGYGQLSWRVHALAMNDRKLFNAFHLDEPWDSPHNLTLMPRMPDDYRTPGVEDPGMTSLHVFVGEKTPFGGTSPPSSREFTDGDSASLLFVVGGPETAGEWTRPGGITFDSAAGTKILGTPPTDKGFPMMFANLTLAIIPPDASPELLSTLVQTGDKTKIDRGQLNLFGVDASREKDADERFRKENIQRVSFSLGLCLSGQIPPPLPINSELSWRVHLLEHIGSSDDRSLLREFHMDEPWDSPHNLPLVSRMPAVYRSPRVTQPGMTAFHVFSGPGSPIDSEQRNDVSDFTDGLENTLLMVVGGPESAVEWTRPDGPSLTDEDLLVKLGTPTDQGFRATTFVSEDERFLHATRIRRRCDY